MFYTIKWQEDIANAEEAGENILKLRDAAKFADVLVVEAVAVPVNAVQANVDAVLVKNSQVSFNAAFRTN